MSEKTFTVTENEEIVITTPRKKTRIISSQPNGKGLIASQRRNDYLPRRKKKSGFFKLYDLGQKLVEGVWRDLDFNVNTGHTVSAEYNSGTSEYFLRHTITPFSLSDWSNLFAQIKDVPFDQWKAKYRKIEYAGAESYALIQYLSAGGGGGGDAFVIGADDPNWTAEGLKTGGEALQIYAAVGLGLSVGLGLDAYKITSEESFSAAEVSFNRSKGGDVFLMPAVMQAVFSSRHGDDTEELFSHFILLSRELYLGNYPSIPITHAVALAIINDVRFRPEAAAYTINRVTGSFSSESPASFPAAYDDMTLGQEATPPDVSFPYTETGTLHAVIMQGNDIFYLWRREAGGVADLSTLFYLNGNFS